ncbi:DUF805 domain-containing protein [Roseateles asaccharophilus]|uniref:Uncharacterized membrane protein YhaH (DUF805 family) n=1 Tax=Roseateles asaccharophilus TaxID=582607 RepID=A0ABU2ADL7_9BURK|nr:DUF805 domain-containing protein [Roseateles asaccharophilus]MDR7335280.1 uncharacterized membrane protein YhaH (DUF805 family) [Roseateles asaccharophilus]
MTFQESIRTCFSKYVDFSGRASRSEYWWFFLFLVIIYVAGALFSDFIYYLLVLGTFLPSLAVAVRRLHDTDRSGWWLLIGFIPLIGGIILIVLLAQEGKGGVDAQLTGT